MSDQAFIQNGQSVSYLSNVKNEKRFLDFASWKQLYNSTDLQLYYSYVKTWFENIRSNTEEFTVKDRYKILIEFLKALCQTEQSVNPWYSQVDTTSDKEILAAIPFFAQKLKDISDYYLKIREDIKQQKSIVSVKGTIKQAESVVKNTLLKNFVADKKIFSSEHFQITNPEVFEELPYLSSLADVDIDVVELYDETSYLGAQEGGPPRFEISANEEFYKSFNIDLVTAEAVYFALTEKPFDERLSLSEYEAFISKFLGADRISVVAYTPTDSKNEETIVWNIKKGFNQFYYASENKHPLDAAEGILPLIPLSAIPFSEAKAGSNLAESDVLAISYGDHIEAAWRMKGATEPFSAEVQAALSKGQTFFLWPYPGYGLSSTDTKWTGPSFSTTLEYSYLDKQLKKAIQEQYWANTNENINTKPININQTTLVECGAKAGNDPLNSDVVTVGEHSAWLSKFDFTQIPIYKPETEITWPFNEEADETSFPQNFSEICLPISIQSIDRSKFVAGSTPEEADCILRIDPNTKNVLSVAWLSGSSSIYTNYNTRMVHQPGFNAYFPSGQVTPFIWCGENFVDPNEVFTYKPHSEACPFRNKTDIDLFETCNCGQTHFSPFGSPQASLESAGIFADFIIEDNDSLPFSVMDINAWRDQFLNTFRASSQIVWYRTSKKAGWMEGRWETPSLNFQQPFTLKTGKRYWYGRVGSRKESQKYPPLAIYHPAAKILQTVWVDGYVLDGQKEKIVSTGKPSEMQIYPGDRLLIKRKSKTTQYLLSSKKVKNINRNEGSIWSSFDHVVLEKDNYTVPVIISWPSAAIQQFSNNPSQIPPVDAYDLKPTKRWEITAPNGTVTTLSGDGVTFAPSMTGVYTISVTATKTTQNSEQVIFNDIPPIVVENPTRTEQTLIPMQTPTPGFVLQVPLQGWDSNLNAPASVKKLSASSGKPFWAEMSENQQESSDFTTFSFTGRKQKLIEGYIPDTQPKLSKLQINSNQKVVYKRIGGTITWKQPIIFYKADNPDKWKKIDIKSKTTFPSNPQIDSFEFFTKALPLNEDSPILLSNYREGLPVSIYYWAKNNFTLQFAVKLTPPIKLLTSNYSIKATNPEFSFPNRYHPFVATIPNSQELFAKDEADRFNIPNSLGVTLFTGSFQTKDVVSEGKSVTNNVTVGGRGNTQQDQQELFAISENASWMKELFTSKEIAGNPRKALTNRFQTFIGYHSHSFKHGLVTNQSLQNPWKNKEWVDHNNQPTNFTGVRNVSAWANSQILKNSNIKLYCWGTDTWGNQYGLYKNYDPHTTKFQEAKNLSNGSLWIRTENDFVFPVEISPLSAVFNHYKDIPALTFIWNQIKNNQIKHIEVFWDVLWIELNSVVVIEKLLYNPDEGTFKANQNLSRHLSLVTEDCVGLVRELKNPNFAQQQTQRSFLSNIVLCPQQKSCFVATLFIDNTSRLNLGLYRYDNDCSLKKVLDKKLERAIPSNFPIQTIISAKLTANKQNQFVLVISGTNTQNQNVIIVAKIKQGNREDFAITKITSYQPVSDLNSKMAPYILDNINLVTVEQGEDQSQILNVVNPEKSNLSCQIRKFSSSTEINENIRVNLIHSPQESINQQILFEINNLSLGLYYVTFDLSNTYGTTSYCLPLSVIPSP